MHATYLRQPFSTLAIHQESSGELVKSIDWDPNTRQISSRLKRLHGGCLRSTGQNLGNRTNFPASLVAQWGRKYQPVNAEEVLSLIQEDPTCRRATKPMSHNYGAHTLEPRSTTREGIATSSPGISTMEEPLITTGEEAWSQPGRSPDHNQGGALITTGEEAWPQPEGSPWWQLEQSPGAAMETQHTKDK